MVGVMHSVAIDGNEIQIDTGSSFFVSHFTNRIWHTVSAVLLRPAQRQHVLRSDGVIVTQPMFFDFCGVDLLYISIGILSVEGLGT